jgi:hypothetical protein
MLKNNSPLSQNPIQNENWAPFPLSLSELYQGRCFQSPPTQTSQELCFEVLGHWFEHFRCSPTEVHLHWTNSQLLSRLPQLRSAVESSKKIKSLQISMALNELGIAPEALKIDVLRVRVFTPEMRNTDAAAPAYFTHRDTWYANPQEQVNIWIPLHDVSCAETFRIFIDYFDRPITNTSEGFNYGHWKKNVGWQNNATDAPALYPRELEPINSREITVSGEKASLWVFSAHHLHQPCHSLNQSRVSIDFRCLPRLSDKAQVPLNIDNASSGSTRDDFFTADTI